ncbi:hypothetical protein T492DRAFT_1115900 [Pavlovales sp. CCMP2436]|nr:hypothetical protein T492DRAFT_1115900 [Pavlovales sp. CCMP2436]
MSSYYQNNAAFLGFKAFDRVDTTYWASGELTYSSSGVGSQWIQIEYPDAVKMSIPMQWTLSGSNNGTNFVNVETFQFNTWQQNKVETFITSQAHVAYKYWRITVTLVRTIGNSIHCAITDIAFNSGWSIGLPSLLTAQPWTVQSIACKRKNNIKNTTTNTMNKFKQDAVNLARASYMPLPQAAEFVKTLGYTLDTELSRQNTMVFVDANGQPTVAHRGSVTAKDWLVDDALIAVGAHKNTDRLNLSRSITAAAEKKYGKPANTVGHSLGGRLAEQSGAGGQIVTINKAAGLGDIGRRQPSGTRQTDVRVGNDAVSGLSSLARRPDSQPIVYLPRRGGRGDGRAASQFLPGPIRYLVNSVDGENIDENIDDSF